MDEVKGLRTRREARERAFQLLYQLEVQHDDQDEQIDRYLEQVTYAPEPSDAWPSDEYPAELGRPVRDSDKQFIRTVVDDVRQNRDSLDDVYVPFLKGWKLERLPLVDRCILRLASYEITRRSDIPFNVSVNEAVLLANKYADVSSRPYINAVLGRLKALACQKDESRSRPGGAGRASGPTASAAAGAEVEAAAVE